MGGAASLGGVTNGDMRDRYFCHQCHHLFNLGPGNGLQCPLCDSMFIEEIGPAGRGGHNDMYTSRQGQLLTSDQSRRIVNATALLRLLEAQLRDELEFLQRASTQGASQNKKQMTHAMRFKCRNVCVTMDQICSQPSCPICTIDFEVDKEATRLPCSHLFHNGCVMPWLEMKQNCPICRTEISPEVLELKEYETYPVKELIERLSILEVEVADIESKTSVDLAFLLHKHLKQLETDEKSREMELEVQRQAEEQQRRAHFDRIMNGGGGSGEDHIHSFRRGPRSVGESSGRMIMLESGLGGASGFGGGGGGGLIFGSLRPMPMMSEFYSNRRLQQRLEEDRSSVRVRSDAMDLQDLMRRSNSGGGSGVGVAPTGQYYGSMVIPHFDSEDGDEEPALAEAPHRASNTRRVVTLLRGTGDANDEDEDDADGSERLRDIERIEREMLERQRRESEQADREDLADLNEWEASQGLPLTRSFRTTAATSSSLSSSAAAAAAASADMQGYAQSFIARVADSALSARVNSMNITSSSDPAPSESRSTRSVRGEWEPDRESLSVRDAITSLRWEVNATVVESDSDD